MTPVLLLFLLRGLAWALPREKRGIVPVHYGASGMYGGGPIMTTGMITPVSGAGSMMPIVGAGVMHHPGVAAMHHGGAAMMSPVAGGAMIHGPLGPMYGVGMHGAVGKKVHDVSNYYGDGKGYTDIYNNMAAKEALRDHNTVDSHGLKGYSGSHSSVDGKEGLQGYHGGAYGGNYHDGAGGYASGHNYHGASGAGGFGGMGNTGHKKAHKTTGFHKSYSNVESGKDTEFVDEDHDGGEESYGKQYGDNFYNGGKGGFEGTNKKGMFGEKFGGDWLSNGGTKAHGSVNSQWGGRDRNGYYTNRDMALDNYHALANNNVNYGQKSYGINGASGMHYHTAPYML